MIRRLSSLLLLLLLLAAPARPGELASCPKSAAEWQQWRDSLSSFLSRTPNAAAPAGEALAQLERCRSGESSALFEREPTIPACLSNLRQFLNSARYEKAAPYSLGFEVPDPKYQALNREFLKVPDFLPSKEFIGWVSDPALLHRASEKIAQDNLSRPEGEKWIAFPFTSQFLASFDSAHTLGRYLVYIPGPVARTVLYSVRTLNEVKAGRSSPASAIAVMAARKLPDGRTEYAFNELMREFGPKEAIQVIAPLTTGHGHLDKCFYCHKSGFMPIFPKEILPADRPAMENFNVQVTAYRAPWFGEYLNIGAHGPALGPSLDSASPGNRRTEAFLKACGGKLAQSKEGREKLSRAMECSSCHSKEGVGVLNYPILRDDRRTNIGSAFVRAGVMPPADWLGFELTKRERESLLACLRSEYYGPNGLFLSWIRERSCVQERENATGGKQH